MSTDAHNTPEDAPEGRPDVGTVRDTFPLPVAHGSGFQVVLNDIESEAPDSHPFNRDCLYNRVLTAWRDRIGSRENEPHYIEFDADWIPDDGSDYVLEFYSSKWKAGHGLRSDYTQFYKYHVVLRREVTNPKTGETEYRVPPLSAHVRIEPQYHDLVYQDGNPVHLPYGTGTRAVIETTWINESDEAYNRLWDVLRAAFGPDAVDPDTANPDSKVTQKVEVHSRFDVSKKNDVVDTARDSESLIAYGGHTEIDGHTKRVREGWSEVAFTADRWDHLGFADYPFEIEMKVYQREDWYKLPESHHAHHPKIEVSMNGTRNGTLPHADEYEEILDYLRAIVATHCKWAGVTRSDLIADDFQDGPAAPEFVYQRPTGRREQLKQKYEDSGTDIYREALKESTESVYDILAIVATECGASYEQLAEKTGLAVSTIRYHVARLAERGVLKRLGNPTLVVYDSELLRENAREILKEAKPGDTPEDREERAEERRENRENRDTTDDTDTDETDDSRNVWRYLDEWRGTPRMLVEEIADGTRSERDVRVRILPDNPPDD